MAIRIERRWLRRLGLATFAVLMLPAYGGEREIYVTTGPDGVEIFSNLPRGPAGNSGIAASALNRGANAVGADVSAHPSWQMAEISEQVTQDNETALGKSFMSDD